MKTCCPYCLEQIEENVPCPSCGRLPGDYVGSSHHFPPGGMLKGRYLVGRVLGEGGFGITYLGLDTVLERKVAIKEYFPTIFVKRESSITLEVTCYTSVQQPAYEKGRDQFLQEARLLAKLDEVPEIVHVLDFFPANNTAYIVMEYLEGKTFRKLLEESGGRIPAKTLLELLDPVLRAIEITHHTGIIHRDISPDNIMQLKNGQIKLIDFGCARDVQVEATLTVMLKHGYAPIEQYTGHNQGPWTDIYALCATMYRCLTGQIPPKALERGSRGQDPLIPPNSLGATLTPEQEQALMRGLEVEPKNRWQSIAGLYAALYGTVIKNSPSQLFDNKKNLLPNEHSREKAENSSEGSQQSQRDKKASYQSNDKHRIEKIIVAFALLSVIIVIAAILNRPKTDDIESNAQGAEVTSGEVAEPGNAQLALDGIAEYNLGMSLFESEDYEEALSHFLAAAEAGNIDAMSMVYRCWWYGASIEQDDALEWIQKAAENDNQYAMRIAAIYIYAENEEYGTAIELLKKAAEAGDTASMDTLGNIYMYGNIYSTEWYSVWDGIEVDEQEAVSWYTKAADAGYAPSMYNLAQCYFNGTGVQKSLESSLEWYRKAADAGNEKAMEAYNRLTDSNIYDTTSVSENYKDGLAAYSSGNYQKAAELYEKAYESDRDEHGLLGLYSMVDWFDQIASEGDSSGVDWLVKVADGLSGSLNSYESFGETSMIALAEKAQSLYGKAINYGNDEAISDMYNLALRFPADSEFFQKWMKIAAEHGSEDAKAFLQ